LALNVRRQVKEVVGEDSSTKEAISKRSTITINQRDYLIDHLNFGPHLILISEDIPIYKPSYKCMTFHAYKLNNALFYQRFIPAEGEIKAITNITSALPSLSCGGKN